METDAKVLMWDFSNPTYPKLPRKRSEVDGVIKIVQWWSRRQIENNGFRMKSPEVIYTFVIS